MGAASSGEEESFEAGLLEYPQYTRPPLWEGRAIPEVLRSGDHAKLAAWRKQRAEDDTRLRRQIGRAHVELQSLMRISYAVFCLKKKQQKKLRAQQTTSRPINKQH